MHARESREHLDRKQKPKINDPFTQNADIWREEGRNRASRHVTREIESVCEREFKFVFVHEKPSEKEEKITGETSRFEFTAERKKQNCN